MKNTLMKILLLVFVLTTCFLFSCEDDEALQIRPVASLKLDIKLGQTKFDFPDSFKAFLEVVMIDNHGISSDLRGDSVVFVRQLSGNHRLQDNVEIPLDKKIIVSIRASFGEYNLLGRSDTIKISAGDNEARNIKIYLTTGNIIIEKPTLLSIGSKAAVVLANIVDVGTSNLTEYGFVWNTSEVTSIDDYLGTYAENSNHIGNYQTIIEDLTPGTTYYISAYAKNASDIVYSDQLSFSTNSSTDNIVLFTNNATGVGPYGATVAASFVDDGSRTITGKGLVWATYSNPDLGNNQGVSFEGAGANSFSSILSSLLDGASYFVRSYAETLEGDVYYGNEISFTTILLTSPEEVEGVLGEVLLHTAKINVSIRGDGGLAITSKGVVYGLTANPSIEDNDGMTDDGIGVADVVSNLTGLTDGVTYYARSYAINEKGVSYSDELSFTTLQLGGIGPGGGIIFVDGGDSGGMEVGAVYTEAIMQWGCATTPTGTVSATFGSGLTNTIAIVNFHNSLADYEGDPTQCSQVNDGSVAAKYCYEFSQNGYNDWFLPSRDELYLFISNLQAIGINDFSPDYQYASSTEVDAFNVKAFQVGVGDMETLKDNYFVVRPVRKF
ncbi:MAG: hypothetical protein PHE33_06185 [Bacteroidales bacterium]|nr:hypothetical protein [Bacteroidales bacterium]